MNYLFVNLSLQAAAGQAGDALRCEECAKAWLAENREERHDPL
jgi:hypothetical protein